MATGVQIGIMDKDGNLLASGSVGEVVIRGESVTSGYLNNPEANASAFTNGWFRTGDQGLLDEHGYLYLTGTPQRADSAGRREYRPTRDRRGAA